MPALPCQIIGPDDVRNLETQLHSAGRRHTDTAASPLRCRKMITRHKVKLRRALFQNDECRAFMRHGQANGIGVEGAGQHKVLSEDFKEEPHLTFPVTVRPSPGNPYPPPFCRCVTDTKERPRRGGCLRGPYP